MRILKYLLVVLMAFGLTACSDKFRTYDGPEVTSIQVQKANRKMYLLHFDQVLESYDIELGSAPAGPKQFEGDGKTPEGVYHISHKNPKSSYHLSLGISYPNDADRLTAAAAGKRPGGDIFIHGASKKKRAGPDWTAGCIAVSDRQMEVIYSMIKPNTPINILP